MEHNAPNLYANNTDTLKLPNITLNENKNYKIAILNAGAVFDYTTGEKSKHGFLNITYDGIRALDGPNPYTVLMISIWLFKNGFNYPAVKPLYLPLRTNQLSSTCFKFNIDVTPFNFFTIFMQIEITESHVEN